MSDAQSKSVSFVRETMLPEQDPPATERGIIKWARENLFSNVTNSVLTIISAVTIYYFVTGIAPWLLNGVWDAPSIRACREILAGDTGGCFAVLTERWNQLLFGFKYPAEEYWRPALAFLLLFVAAAPVMFFKYLPRQMLIFTALYPFLAFWLIWGTDLARESGAVLGLTVGYVVKYNLDRRFVFVETGRAQ